MSLLLFIALLSTTSSTIINIFEESGLQYEKIGKAKLIDASRVCLSHNVSLTPYVDALAMGEEAEEADMVMLKAHMRRVFEDTCHEFNLTDEFTSSQSDINLKVKPSKYLNDYGLKFNIKKFQNDLLALFLHNKINAPFFDAFEKGLMKDEVGIEFAKSAVFLPRRCDISTMTIEAQYCSWEDKSVLESEIYAIAHTGQMMEKSKAFVLYEVPDYVLIKGDEIFPVNFDSCKAMDGTYFLCMEKIRTYCDITTITSCDLYAMPTDKDFYFTRSYGSGMIVATNLSEVNIDGTMVKAVSPVFTYHTSQYVEKDADDQPLILQTTKTSPAMLKAPLPELTQEAEKAVRSAKQPIRLYRITRKGIDMLNDKPSKASVWDDVRDFFMHLV
ncbi:unnamed protein product [Cylicocyclus nassatus]|uniref:Uncharacterized protein n=1 Tax=Cylicocyclus nassatus TaxID=53992 RepID=A0AA36HAF4_CYLNA|nr:unnamed protein product [Cylicocyclus nassatus]